MPLLKLETTVPLTEATQQVLLPALSKIVAETIGKPEQYVMVSVSQAALLMAGQTGPAAFGDLRSIGGLSGEVNQQLAQRICAQLHETLQIPPNRVYLNFLDIRPANWGWNGATFG